ncbi:protein disulfide-isomerase precursor [Modicella reniformis]|uniref:Protein disulfide-isomerase n=1 Tax=Modicella reniformis TaxID=1440133 RepID=A0A9P6IJB8_9FUNG|nr:protein disulfide-isomerase precursor [Modicella reniformis]
MRLSAAIALVGLAATSMLAGVRADSDVLDLSTKNFQSTVDPENLILVEFFAPWCGHCKALAPEYEIAATHLKVMGIPIAKVDCTVEGDLCKEYGVQGYPTLKVFRNGKASNYSGTRKADAIVSYMKKKSLPPLSEVPVENLAAFSQSERVVIVGVFPKDSEKRTVLEKVAKAYGDDYVFGVVEESPEIKEGVILYKKFDEGKNILEADFTEDSLIDFVKSNSIPNMDEISAENYSDYIVAGIPLAYYFYEGAEQRSKFSTEIEGLAKELKGKMNFVYIDAGKFGAHAANLNLKESWPAFAIQHVKVGTKFPLEGEVSFDTIKALTEGFLAGTVEPSIKSEPIPETNDDSPVKVVVSHTYKEIVEDFDKDVLIEFYAPWCGHCKNLAPTYEKLGELYKGSNIVIAKFDATTNDLPSDVPFQVEGFPTIKFRKAGSTEYIDYNGNRTEEGFIEFITENAVNKYEVKKEEKPVEADDVEHDEL